MSCIECAKLRHQLVLADQLAVAAKEIVDMDRDLRNRLGDKYKTTRPVTELGSALTAYAIVRVGVEATKGVSE